MIPLEDGGALLVDLVTKGGGTFVGAVGALGLIWKVAIAPLATRLLDMHEKLARDVSDALSTHSNVLSRINDRTEQIEEMIETYLHDRREDQRK